MYAFDQCPESWYSCFGHGGLVVVLISGDRIGYALYSDIPKVTSSFNSKKQNQTKWLLGEELKISFLATKNEGKELKIVLAW